MSTCIFLIRIRCPVSVYLLGGGNLILRGVKDSTKDVDFIVDDRQTFVALAESLQGLKSEECSDLEAAYNQLDPSIVLEKDGRPRWDIFVEAIVGQPAPRRGACRRREATDIGLGGAANSSKTARQPDRTLAGPRSRSHAVARPLPRVHSVITTSHTPSCRVFSVKHEGTAFYRRKQRGYRGPPCPWVKRVKPLSVCIPDSPIYLLINRSK